jgi:hypothetical protein
MTIDERLHSLADSIERLGQKTDERLSHLAERQHALTESVELLAGMQQKTEKEIRRLGRYVRVIVIEHEARLLRLEGQEEDDDEPEAGGNGR